MDPRYEPQWGDRLFGGLAQRLRGFRMEAAQNKLEKKLANIIEIAEVQRSRGIRFGDPRYIRLHDKADAMIAAFSIEWGVSRSSIEDGWPALEELVEMTKAQPMQSVEDKIRYFAPRVAFSLACLSVVATVVIAVLSVLGTVIYHYGTFFIR